jgi:hypothetical protein
MNLVFEPTETLRRAWKARDAATGEVIGGVEWLEGIGAYGFAFTPSQPVSVFTDPAILREVGRFLYEVTPA